MTTCRGLILEGFLTVSITLLGYSLSFALSIGYSMLHFYATIVGWIVNFVRTVWPYFSGISSTLKATLPELRFVTPEKAPQNSIRASEVLPCY